MSCIGCKHHTESGCTFGYDDAPGFDGTCAYFESIICKYADKCGGYNTESYTCNEDPGKYCGIFREFKAKE